MFWNNKKYFVQHFELVRSMKFSFHLIEFISFPIPKTEEEWLAVAKQFQELWDFPHSLRPIDRKHGTTVSKIVPVHTLTTKIPSVL
jgi:hypothetical protein